MVWPSKYLLEANSHFLKAPDHFYTLLMDFLFPFLELADYCDPLEITDYPVAQIRP